MLIFNQIYKKFLIQYVLFSLNLYRNLQTPHKNITFKSPVNHLINALIKAFIKALINAPVNAPVMGLINIYYMCLI